MKTPQELQEQVDYLETVVEQGSQVYSQVNKLLLWKSALKVKVNEQCPFKEIVGKEGYIGDLFPNGFTVWHPKPNGESDFWRLHADWLDVVEWDKTRFEQNMKDMKYQQIQGKWTYIG